MAYPVGVVEIGFGASDTPYTLNPTWVDVSADVLEMSIDRGRSDDWGTFSGSAFVTLNNNSRNYDPFNTSGTYYGKLTPRRQIRIRATYGGTTYDVFRGFIDGFSPQWTEAGKSSTVTLSCFDALQLLGSNTLPADWAHKYILTTAPRHYYPCNEPITPFVVGSTLKDYGAVPLDMTTSINASNGSQLAQGLTNSSVQGTGGTAASSATGSTQGVGNFSASMWALFDNDTIFTTGGNTYNCPWSIEYEASTSMYLLYMLDYNSNVQRIWKTVQTFDGGVGRFLAFTFNGTSKAITFYIDGVAQAMTTVAPTGIFPFPTGEGYFLGSGQTQQLCVWDGIISQAVFQEIYKYSTVTLPETTSARVARIIAETPFSSSLVSTPASPAASVLDITDDAPTVSTELQKVADSEYAPLFVSKTGVLTLYSQNQIRTQTRSIVSQVTYGTGGVAIGKEIDLTLDGDSMRNTANVAMSQGGVWVKENTTSRDAYGTAEITVDSQVQTLTQAQAIANIATGWGGNIYPKASPVDVVLSGDNSWASTLDLELNDRFTLVVSPPTGNSVTTPMLLQRITHSVVAGQWATTVEGSARWAAVFIIGSSLIGGTDLLG